jgi:hypothetical protein
LTGPPPLDRTIAVFRARAAAQAERKEGTVVDRSGSEPRTSQGRAKTRAGRLGRRIATATYLVFLGYIVVVGYATVLTKVYSGPTPAEIAAVRGVSCEDGLVTLRDALFVRASEQFGRGGGLPLDAFFDRWDHRYRPLASRCPHDPYPELLRLRHHLELTLRRFDRDEGKLVARLTSRDSRSPAGPH